MDLETPDLTLTASCKDVRNTSSREKTTLTQPQQEFAAAVAIALAELWARDHAQSHNVADPEVSMSD